MYFKRWKIFTAQPLNRLKYTDPFLQQQEENFTLEGNEMHEKLGAEFDKKYRISDSKTSSDGLDLHD